MVLGLLVRVKTIELKPQESLRRAGGRALLQDKLVTHKMDRCAGRRLGSNSGHHKTAETPATAGASARSSCYWLSSVDNDAAAPNSLVETIVINNSLVA
jgi:hypothetical protein